MKKYILTYLLPLTYFACPLKAQQGNSISPLLNQNNSIEISTEAKKIQLVFCLDVTGSMGGLISTAKQKIWSIASSLLQAEPKPSIEMGMVFYRDRGDNFITKRIDFSQNIDSVYAKLMEMTAGGGGDAPESVNQALDEAVTKFQWYADTSVYKSIFLVGDCPPHMDYTDDVKYPVSCRLALKKDIIINTLQMGNCYGAGAVWKEIANLTGGEYISVDQAANGYVVTTPYDTDIATFQNRIDNTVVYYGTSVTRINLENNKVQANKIYKTGKANESASRAEYKKSKGMATDVYYRNDLLKDFVDGRINPDTMNEKYLPDTMRKMTIEQRKVFLTVLKTERDSAQAQLNTLIEKRNEYIKTKTETEISTSSNSFSNKVYDAMKKQTVKKGVVLKGKVKE